MQSSETTLVSADPAKRYGVAALLGLAALALRTHDIPLLTPETPVFLLGGGLVLLAFAILGEGPGLFAGLISIAVFLAEGRAVDVVTLLYVVEQWVAYRIFRRFGSFVMGTVGFWLGVGWLADLVLYRVGLGLSSEYVVLLFIKQLFNGVLDALVAEGLLMILPQRLRGDAQAARRLRHFVVGRVLFVVMAPLLLVALVYTREVYQRHIHETSAEARDVARGISEAVAERVRTTVAGLRRLARSVEIARGRGEPASQSQLDAVLEAHPDIFNVCVSDGDGRVIACSPTQNALGEPLVGFDLGRRSYFLEARETLETAFAPLILGTLHVRLSDAQEPVLIVAEPLFDPRGEFAGVAYAAVDARAFEGLLLAWGPPAPATATLVDRAGVVIASLDPRFEVGGGLPGVPVAQLVRPGAGDLVYYPPEDESRESRLRLNLRHARLEPVLWAGWSVLVDRPAAMLHQRMMESAWPLIAAFAGVPLLIVLLVSRISRRIADPLERIEEVAREIAGDGEVRALRLAELSASPIADFQEVGRDLERMRDALTERDRQRLLKLESSERRYRSVVENVGTLLLTLAPDGAILEFNRAAESVFGVSRDAALGRDYVESFVPRPAQKGVRKDLAAVLRGGASSRYEGPVVTAAGMRRVVVWTWTRLEDESGQGAGVIASGEDVTEARELQQQLFQAQKLESVGRLAGGVAHDFNNLLTALLAGVDLAEMELEPDHPAVRELETIRSVSHRASRLTRQLLGFARRQTWAPQVLDLNRLIGEGQAMLRRVIGEDVELTTRLERDLWTVRADPGQLEQVLVNLAVNARDAMPRGGELSIRTSNVRLDESEAQRLDLPQGDYVRWEVADTGEGIPEELRAHVFEPFFTTKEQGKGTGLGLATCYGIVAQNGGRLELTGREGGAEFHAYLPRVDAPVSVSGDSSGIWPVTHGTETILLAEDDAAVRRSLVRALQERGYQVLAAEGGEQALALAGRCEGSIDLLVTDVVMPRMSGPELAERLISDRPGLRVLLMSGYAPGLLERTGPLGSRMEFIAKPFTGAKLARRVRAVLDSTGHART